MMRIASSSPHDELLAEISSVMPCKEHLPLYYQLQFLLRQRIQHTGGGQAVIEPLPSYGLTQ